MSKPSSFAPRTTLEQQRADEWEEMEYWEKSWLSFSGGSPKTGDGK